MSTSDDQEPSSLASIYTAAEALRNQLDLFASNSTEFSSTLWSAISKYKECVQLSEQLGLFSPNETLDDIATSSIPFLLLHFRLSELILRIPGGLEAGRKDNILEARIEIEKFLGQLDNYGLLGGKVESEMWERYTENKDGFEVIAKGVDPQTRRNEKIQRWKQEKQLKSKLEYLSQNTHITTSDDSSVRTLHLASIALAVHDAFSSLESINLELTILAQAPSRPTVPNGGQEGDPRARQKALSEYSERLDPSLRSLLQNGRGGPILDRNGRPLQPFTLLDKRSQLQQGVFRPDYNLPTMSIDEYLEEERRRGGIIEGGGEKSGIRPEVDEDDMEKADQETMKQREWDEFKEANPKGSGNTLNRG